MGLSSCFYYKRILNISQTTGLRDPECGCSLSPFSFLEVGCSGNHGRGFLVSPSSSSRPVWHHDCNRGQHPASSEVSDDSARQD